MRKEIRFSLGGACRPEDQAEVVDVVARCEGRCKVVIHKMLEIGFDTCSVSQRKKPLTNQGL